MSVISINEVKRQKPSSKEVPLSIKELEKELPNIMDAINNGGSPFIIIDHLSFVDERLKNNLRGVTDKNEAISCIYNYILHATGDGVLKEYEMKCVPHKGSAIGGMECHSFGH